MLHTLLFKRFPKKKGASAPFRTPSYSHDCESHMRSELNGILRGGAIITSKFIHNIAQKDTEDSHIPSLFFSPFLRRLSLGTKGGRTGVPSRPKGSQARPQRAAHHFQF